MSLRLFKLNKTHKIPITIDGEETVFNFKSMTIEQKTDLLMDIQNQVPEDQVEFSKEEMKKYTNDALKKLCEAIESIEGEDGTPLKILSKLENRTDLKVIVETVCSYCVMTPDEIKNSKSSSNQLIPASVGNAEKIAKPEKEDVSTTQTKTDTSQPKDKV